MRIDIFTPITLKSDPETSKGKVLPIRRALAEGDDPQTEIQAESMAARTALDLERDNEFSTEQVINFLERRKARRKLLLNPKLAKYQDSLAGISISKGRILSKKI